MNILFIKPFFVGFIVSEIPRVSVFGYFPLYYIFAYQSLSFLYIYIYIYNIILIIAHIYGVILSNAILSHYQNSKIN